MTLGARKAALLFAALALALFAAGSWRAEARTQRVTTEHRIYHYATVTPELLCPKRPASAAGAWLRLAIAQQADGSGNAWIIKCAY